MRFQFQQLSIPIGMFKFQIQFLQVLIPIQIPILIPKHSMNQTPPKSRIGLVWACRPMRDINHTYSPRQKIKYK
ncbi:hypothetical protein HanHA89_Chr02g0055741 [Helianthus annuus]|nr:hypothetical protein HanHA89_Chr02g0055741 [Helianthus annuus]